MEEPRPKSSTVLKFIVLVLEVVGAVMLGLLIYSLAVSDTPHVHPPYAGEEMYVHLIPHSHLDLGWLETVEGYYNGSVRQILDSVSSLLLSDPSKTFTFSESAYFSMWWKEQSEATKASVRQLVASGQLSFAGGGWVSHDEATTTFEDQVDQMALGHKFLYETFGVKPRVAWQLDPFGHSAASPELFAKMGLQAVFFARMDERERNLLRNGEGLEMIWRPETNSGSSSSIFAHLLYDHYSFPSCLRPKNRLDIDVVFTNEATNNFINWIQIVSKSFKTKHILVAMGNDFVYKNATYTYSVIDELISSVLEETDEKVKVIYSTPDRYLDAVHKEQVEFPVRSTDFFPYLSDAHDYWTGFYSTRQNFKELVRHSGARLRATQNLVSKRLLSVSSSNSTFSTWALEKLEALQLALGIVQHHDAITGTSRMRVMVDNSNKLVSARKDVDEVLSALAVDVTWERCRERLEHVTCNLVNETVCDIMSELNETTGVTLLVFNPTYYSVSRVIAIPVGYPEVDISDSHGKAAKYDVTRNFYTPEISRNQFTIFLKVVADSMESVLFRIRPGDKPCGEFSRVDNDTAIANEQYQLTLLNDDDGKSVWNFERLHSRVNTLLTFSLGYYRTSTSGTYVFHPLSSVPDQFGFLTDIWVYQGSVVHIAVLSYNTTGFQYIYLYKGSADPFPHIQTWINSLSDGDGKEVVVLFTTSLNFNEIFATDANGLSMVQRQRKYCADEPVACNYYPVTAAISFEDYETSVKFTVLPDRSQGGTVADYGSGPTIELMVHRRVFGNDQKGLDELLNDKDPYDSSIGIRTVVNHRLVLGTGDTEQATAQETFWKPLQVLYAKSVTDEFQNTKRDQKWLKAPANFHIDIKPKSASTFIIRVLNIATTPSTFNFSLFLSPIESGTVFEVGLSENQPIEDVYRSQLHWNTKIDNKLGGSDYLPLTLLSEEDVVLIFTPKQLRSFLLTI